MVIVGVPVKWPLHVGRLLASPDASRGGFSYQTAAAPMGSAAVVPPPGPALASSRQPAPW